MTTLEGLDALIERGVFYDCDWQTLKKARGELAMSDYGKWQPIDENTPRDGTQFFVTHPDWECPAVAHYCMDADRFVFSESALAEIDGGTFDLDGCRWLPVPPVEGE